MNILADVSLAGLHQAFPPPFRLTFYHNLDEVTQLIPGQDVLLCRATLKVTSSLLKNNSLRFVATATSGTDHIDCNALAEQNIQLITAQGCNARAVADYVVSCLAYLELHHHIKGKKAGIIGLGNTGSHVAARLKANDFELVTYDPSKELRKPHGFFSCALEDLHRVDLLCIHAELHNTPPYPSLDLINEQFLEQLNPGCVIINTARGGIVNEEALLANTKKLVYCADVYLNEPDVDERIIDLATLCTPHIAGHSLEAKYGAVSLLSTTLHQIAGLNPPQFALPEMDLVHLSIDQTWQKNVLSLYNPSLETMKLKKSKDKKSTFLKLRTQHQQRHDFNQYVLNELDRQCTLLLGGC